jgi:hypothetical protein
MRAMVMLLHAQLRQHWKSWLALASLAVLVGGFVLAAAATGRRTAAAFPDFVARHGYDAIVYSNGPLKGRGLAGIPQVAQAVTVQAPYAFPVGCSSCHKPIDPSNFDVLEVPPASLPRTVQVQAGRMPDQARPDEVLASYTFGQDYGVRLGSVIQVLLPTPRGGFCADRIRDPRWDRGAVRPVRHEGVRGGESAREEGTVLLRAAPARRG